VMWVPTWNEAGLVAVAHVRPTTAPTSVPDDVPGTFSPRGRNPHLDQAAAFGRAIVFRDAQRPSVPLNVEAYPIRHGDRVIGVVARHASVAPRVAGQLEEIYLTTADDLFAMLVDGRYPVPDIHTDALGSPRVGDGVIRLSADGRVDYASPNSVSALRRLGLATDVVGSPFVELAARLSHRPGPVDEALSAVASGRVAGSSDIENGSAIVLLRSIPLARRGQHVGAIVFLQDVTEIHHRVKNNLQTVAAMLRLQARRASTPEAREALAEAELRVSAIAVVHESLTADVGEQVDFDAIVDRIIGLVRDLAPAYAGGAEPPSIAREGTLGQLSADQATPLAMVVSELLHNAVEHASAAAITVGLQRRTAYGHDLVDLTVLDDGCGLPDGFDATETGLGLSIVQALVSGDLRGTCEFAGNAEGTTVSVAFPVSRAR
jgi:two-component sensor histidine kinase